ncbi:hypothetical protein AUC70_07175 [Methyloceanibacter stevinii]|uniref:Uncharacterized protein n=1 Tax=Methyloceanibacter stevinii TaxID=1774970 RepID=A0A1E3VLM1_9HYPH|nr:hypothetical protein AUC70_07175 [Methyloceanibacter stevinii]
MVVRTTQYSLNASLWVTPLPWRRQRYEALGFLQVTQYSALPACTVLGMARKEAARAMPRHAAARLGHPNRMPPLMR